MFVQIGVIFIFKIKHQKIELLHSDKIKTILVCKNLYKYSMRAVAISHSNMSYQIV